jgi:hypothetical protein
MFYVFWLLVRNLKLDMFVLCTLFHWAVLFIDYEQMRIVLLPPCVNPIAANEIYYVCVCVCVFCICWFG